METLSKDVAIEILNYLTDFDKLKFMVTCKKIYYYRNLVKSYRSLEILSINITQHLMERYQI